MSTKKPNIKPLKLEEVSKKEVFTVPDNYFDKLPTIIQARAIESTKKRASLVGVGSLKLAIPVVLLLIMAGYFGYKFQYNPTKLDTKIETMLADISTEELVSFIGETEITSDELLELVSFEGESLEDFSTGIEDVSDEDLQLLINDFDLENINSI